MIVNSHTVLPSVVLQLVLLSERAYHVVVSHLDVFRDNHMLVYLFPIIVHEHLLVAVQ